MTYVFLNGFQAIISTRQIEPYEFLDMISRLNIHLPFEGVELIPEQVV